MFVIDIVAVAEWRTLTRIVQECMSTEYTGTYVQVHECMSTEYTGTGVQGTEYRVHEYISTGVISRGVRSR